MRMARYVEGGAGHDSTGWPLDPANTPRDATSEAIASKMPKRPDNGPKKINDARQGLRSCWRNGSILIMRRMADGLQSSTLVSGEGGKVMEFAAMAGTFSLPPTIGRGACSSLSGLIVLPIPSTLSRPPAI